MSASSVVTVGGLLPRDLLDRIAVGDRSVPGMDPTDYGLAQGERLNDAITRSWNRLQGVWEAFRRAEADLPASEPTATALTRDRWLRPLCDELGFAGLPLARGLSIDGKDYPISHQWGATVPVHLPGARVPIDRISRGVPGAAKASPHGLVQEFLNRSESNLWGIVSNGLLLRILRNNASLTRQAYVEFDLEAMFDSEAYNDFVLLWLCCHRSRFEGDPAEKCLLEQWMAEAASAGTRALDKLRDGVETAIKALGEGFVAHPANAGLRQALHSGELSAEELQRQLLRLVYRLLFLLVAESRDLLLDPKSDGTARQRYQSFYSMERLRNLAIRRRGTAHDDLWRSLVVTMRALESKKGEPAIGIAPLGSFLWSPKAVAALAGAQIDNRHLLDAVRYLCYVRDDEAKIDRRVDYRNLGADELGSVYESLLELHAEVDADARTFDLESVAGSERKTTGSYYTPTPLIQVLLESALDPVLVEAQRAAEPEAALLGLKVMDPAVGSGHFLIAAANRIAGRLASVRAGWAEPSPEEVSHALRDVIGRCLYGIDVNPLAVELCKVSLWMEAHEPGRPLSFLDHRIVCANSLLGAAPALIEAGVPDEAFKPIEGDDKKWASTLRKTNKRERTHRNQGVLDFESLVAKDVTTLAEGLADIDALGEDSIEAISEKEARFAELQASEAAARAKLVADAWCAAFVAPKTKDAPILTDALVRTCASSPEKVPADVRQVIHDMADRYRFLHPHVAFPDIFTVPDNLATAENELCGWNGGFDVVLGNPPWDRVKLQEKEWFAARDPEIATAPNAAARKRLIQELKTQNPALHATFLDALRRADGESALLRNSGRYPLTGRGDVNTYAVFAELMRNAMSPPGRVGAILPTGIATDDTTKLFFADLVERRSLVSLFDFRNKGLFPGIAGAQGNRFCLLTISAAATRKSPVFLFRAESVSDIEDSERRFTLTLEDFALLNPNTKTCPVFRTRRDAEITKAIYRRVPVMVQENDPNGNPWGMTFQRMFDMANDSHLFRTREELEADGWTLEGNHFVRDSDRYLPLYEAKMIHHFDARYGDYRMFRGSDKGVRQLPRLSSREQNDPVVVPLGRYWVPEADVVSRLQSPTGSIGFRDVTSGLDERTFIAAVVPPVAVGHKLPLLTVNGSMANLANLLATLASFVLDFVARQKSGGTGMTFFVVRQLAVPTNSLVTEHEPGPAWCVERVLELTYTAWDLELFAADLGYHGPPFRWDEERRALLRAELDALMFRLYGIERDDVDYILDTFPIVKRKDEAAFGEYRTKRLILERYDAMAEAEAAGQPYKTILDPPPADPSLAHPESTRPDWAV